MHLRRAYKTIQNFTKFSPSIKSRFISPGKGSSRMPQRFMAVCGQTESVVRTEKQVLLSRHKGQLSDNCCNRLKSAQSNCNGFIDYICLFLTILLLSTSSVPLGAVIGIRVIGTVELVLWLTSVIFRFMGFCIDPVILTAPPRYTYPRFPPPEP
jgi:hypothetical protein